MMLLTVPNANAAIDAYPFPNDELRERYQQLIDELRCPQCLNTNLAGSDAMIARDLRREVHRLLLDGKTDDEILDFMQKRYGDFILYDPKLKSSTLLLWFGPLLILLFAAGFVVRFIRARQVADVVLSEEEHQRLQKLIESP